MFYINDLYISNLQFYINNNNLNNKIIMIAIKNTNYWIIFLEIINNAQIFYKKLANINLIFCMLLYHILIAIKILILIIYLDN